MRDITVLEKEEQSGSGQMLGHHFHDECELYYLLSGQRKYFIGDRCVMLKQGSLVFINRRVLHRTIPGGEGPLVRFLLHFRPEFLQRWQRMFTDVSFSQLLEHSFLLVQLEGDERAYCDGITDTLLRAREQGDAALEQIKTLELLLMLTRKEKFAEAQEPQKSTDVKMRRFEEITNYIAQQGFKVNLEELSSHFYISRYYLCHLFKEVSGVTIGEYINYNKILLAQELLEYTELPVMQVSEKAGFESITQFGRVFKAYARVSPREYRKRFRAMGQHLEGEAE